MNYKKISLKENIVDKYLLFDNAHFAVAVMGDPSLKDILAQRYIDFIMKVIPQIVSHIQDKYGDGTKIVFINLLGSASVYRTYVDIDFSIGLVGGKTENEKILIAVKDETGESYQRTAEIYYYEMYDINESDYIRFMYSKPTLIGRVPDVYRDRITELLRYSVEEALEKVRKRIEEDNYRKAAHLLIAACRHIYGIYKETNREWPDLFEENVKLLYSMEHSNSYNPEQLEYIFALVKAWISQ